MMLKHRPATLADWAHLWAWRNDIGTRTNFFNSSEVHLKNHLAWLEQALADEDVRIYILEDDSHGAVGMFRLTLRHGDIECSIIVAPRHRGKGYGSLLVSRMRGEAEELAEKLPRWRLPLRADIKLSNVASICAFAAAGFAPSKILEPDNPAEARVAPSVVMRPR
jgi:GNAT superfamily N-acetyltransferase